MSVNYETLIVERRGAVGWLVFDRPDAGNAMNAQMMRELEAAWQELDSDADVRVIVNTGNGDAFQTGVDVAQMSRDLDALREQSRRTKRFELGFTGWHNGVTKPVIVKLPADPETESLLSSLFPGGAGLTLVTGDVPSP